MPLPDFDTLAPVQSKSALPDFDSLKPYVPSAPRFDPSKIQLDPYQDYYKKTGLTEPASENFQSWQSRQPPEKSAIGPATGIGALTGLDRAKYFIQTKLEKVFPGMAEKGSPSPASVVGGAAMVAPLGLPETLGKLLLGYFAYRTAAAQPDIYRQIKSEIQSGNYSEAQRTAVEDLLQMGMIGTGAAGLRKPAPQFQGPLATGEVLQRPPGAIPEPPPDLGPIPGVPTHGIPTPSIPDPSYPKNRPVVPGTAAERRETAVETIRRAQATTKEQIQQLFPKANLSRQQAAAWRDLAWGKPSTLNPQPSTPTPNARQIQTPAAVYGDLRPQPVASPGPVPVPESGGRIQPQAEGRLPETPPGQVPLTPPAPEPITAASQKVSDKVKTVAQTQGPRPAKNIKDELVANLQQMVMKAPMAKDAKTGDKVTIEIPDDGTFTIPNTYESLSLVLERAQKIKTDSGKPPGVPKAAIKSSGRAIQATAGENTRIQTAKKLEEQKSGKGTVMGFGGMEIHPPTSETTSAVSPERRAELSTIGTGSGLRFDGVHEFPGITPILSFTFNGLPKDDPAFGLTFNTKVDATNEQILTKAQAKATEFAEAKGRPSEAVARVGAELRAELERRQQQPTGPDKPLAFGGTQTGSPATPPVATTPQQLASLQKTMMPGFAAGVREGVLSLLLPSAKSPAHLRAAEKFGARLGAMNQRAESTAFALRGPGKVFDRLGVHNEKLPPDKNPGIKFMSDMSQGRKLRHPFEHVSDLVQKLFDDRLTKLAEAGAPLQSVRENYFPGMWTRESRLAFNAALDEAQKQGVLGKDSDVNNATPAQKAWVKSRVDQLLKSGQGSEADMMAYFTRRPLKGQESFRKQKVFDDVMTGAEFGLQPLSNNPIDLVKWKLAEMDRSIMANEFFQQLKTDGELKVINPYEDTPAGWVRLKDKYGTIYGPPTVTIPEHLDKAVYEGLLDFAGKLGIKHQRTMKFPPGPGNRALGLSYQGQDFVRTRFATETSVLAHEIGHQLDYRHDFWNKFVTEAVGLGKKGVQTKGASQKQRGLIKTELRNIADLTGSRGGDPRKKEEQIAQMVEAYVHAPEKMREVAPTVFKVFDDFIHSKPELKGLADIKPGIELEKLTSDKYVGLPIKGYRIVPKATGDIVNNYLSSSLYNSPGLGGLYKAWMGTANALNQSQLGLGSAFHAGFTTGDVQVSAGATLIKDVYGVLRGNRSLSDLGGTVKNWTAASVKTALTGDKVLNAWRDPDGVIDPRIAQVVKATELAGGGYKLEHGMQTEQTTKMLRDWYSGSRLKAAGRSPIALTELMMKPIMDFLVPRQKAGVFADLAWRIIDQNAGKPLEELTPQFRQAWNRVDARLGQVRYDRLFANNTAKGMVQALVRAPGWSGGTIAELGGSFPDAANFFKEWIKTGRLPDNIPDRVAYTMSLLATVGTANAVLTYAFTGQTPTGMDFLAFRTGRKDKDGNNERFMLPTYVKDLLAYSKQPGTTVLHKSTPLASVLGDVLNNRDYYGYEIRNPNDPYVKQAGQAGKYVIKSFEPFWIQGAVKAAQAGVSPGRLAAPYVGVMPAPAYITRSSIQNQISDLYHKRTGERLKPYGTQEADAAKRVAHQTGAMDVYMFHHLPKTDQAALAQKMSAGEKEHYGVGQSSATSTATRRPAPWAVQGP
jgi:hypothetical protein